MCHFILVFFNQCPGIVSIFNWVRSGFVIIFDTGTIDESDLAKKIYKFWSTCYINFCIYYYHMFKYIERKIWKTENIFCVYFLLFMLKLLVTGIYIYILSIFVIHVHVYAKMWNHGIVFCWQFTFLLHVYKVVNSYIICPSILITFGIYAISKKYY